MPPPPRQRFATCAAHFAECEVSVLLFGLDLDPDAVTRRLGVPPSEAHRAGEVLHPRSGRTAATGSWRLSVEGAPPTLPSDLVRQVLAALPTDRAFWSGLRDDYQVQIRFSFHGSGLTGCFELDEGAAAALAITGAEMAFHLYRSD